MKITFFVVIKLNTSICLRLISNFITIVAVLKWNFTTPREEFFELLKEQMNSAGLNKQLVANMFHADFRYLFPYYTFVI